MGEESRKERVMEETEKIVNETSQENQNIDANGKPALNESDGEHRCEDSESEAKAGGSDETTHKDSGNGEDFQDEEKVKEGADADYEKEEGIGENGKKGDASGTEKRGFFGKKKEKKDPRDTQIEELTDRVRRTMAEFDNFRKRTEKEKSAMFEIGAKDIIERILPVIDNFERGLNSMPEDAKGTSFAEGMEMIYKQLLKNLEEAGVKPIEAVGQQFDPNFHNAVMHVEDEEQGENVVVQELQKGYLYRDSVVRHSMVQVAN